MRIKAVVVLLFFTVLYQKTNAQVIITTSLPDSITYWERTNKLGLDINQVAFINWSIGGNNSIAGVAKADFIRNYSRKNINWNNELILRYGLQQ